MAELKHILAATDLSAPARHAVERAALVAAGNDAALAMIHIANLAPLDVPWQVTMASTIGLVTVE